MGDCLVFLPGKPENKSRSLDALPEMEVSTDKIEYFDNVFDNG